MKYLGIWSLPFHRVGAILLRYVFSRIAQAMDRTWDLLFFVNLLSQQIRPLGYCALIIICCVCSNSIRCKYHPVPKPSLLMTLLELVCSTKHGRYNLNKFVLFSPFLPVYLFCLQDNKLLHPNFVFSRSHRCLILWSKNKEYSIEQQ